MRYHIKLNYFHGSMLVMQHMRAALVRKYLTLSAVNHAQETSLRYEFQTAISHTVDQVIAISPVSPMYLHCISTVSPLPTSPYLGYALY